MFSTAPRSETIRIIPGEKGAGGPAARPLLGCAGMAAARELRPDLVARGVERKDVCVVPVLAVPNVLAVDVQPVAVVRDDADAAVVVGHRDAGVRAVGVTPALAIRPPGMSSGPRKSVR